MAMPNPGASQSVEALILKATNPLNKADDPNIVQSICQAIGNEAGGVYSAIRLLVHKIHSPQEKEAMQALLVLQACVNNCGPSFHTEIGKFRFLNEMIKLVSPKYLGNQTPPSIKDRVTQLLYTWTIDITDEPKIQEAYTMLKKQGIVEEDPSYLGVPSSLPPKVLTPASFEDDEKSRALQRLLQSTKPEDIVKANALIKNMVKEDERRLERTSRRIVEVETALNNVKVLDEMLNQYEETHCVSKADVELMEELNSACTGLRTNIHRIVSEMDEKEDGLGELIKASDELFRVSGRYKLVAEGRLREGTNPGASVDLANNVEEDTLLDLLDSSPDTKNGINNRPHESELKFETKELFPTNHVQKTDSSPFDDLEDIFSNERRNPKSYVTGSSQLEDNLNLLMTDSIIPPPLIPQRNIKERLDPVLKEKVSPKLFNDLDILGSALLQESLPQYIPRLGSQFKPQEKVSLNEMKEKNRISTSPYTDPSNKIIADKHISEQYLMQHNSGVDKFVDSLDDISLLSGNSRDDDRAHTILGSNIDDSNSENSLNLESLKIESSSDSLMTALKGKQKVQRRLSENAQLCEVKAMNDLSVSLEEIRPGNHAPIKLIESNGISLTLHFTENKPREDVSIIVASVTSVNSQLVSNYTLQAVVPKGCKVRLLPPSSTKLCEYSPFLPPPAITQIMLIANPNQLNVSLKAMLSYTINDDFCSEMGEMENLPL